MPGHKGDGFLGTERLDITEIDGADSLYEASGIIAESEQNASAIFGCDTFYSTEGSSQCIRAMLWLLSLCAVRKSKKPVVATVRNVHKTFLSAAALLNINVQWLYPENSDGYLSCVLSDREIDRFLETAKEKPTAVYLTSPDYLGRLTDIRAIAEVCHKHGVLLAVDNAHGAYLKFLNKSLHPIDLGADICCDSAHKTLPVLTGGAYLHIGNSLKENLSSKAKEALALFGSTSPSYLVLQSLDAANRTLEGYSSKLNEFVSRLNVLKENLSAHGYTLYGDEPLKLTISTKPYGYLGYELADALREHNIECEFCDKDFLVLMLTPGIKPKGLERLESALLKLKKKAEICEQPPVFHEPKRVLSVREALLADFEILPANECINRVIASSSVGCPPAVPLLVCGEVIDAHALACFRYYGIEECCVVKNGYNF